MNPETDLGTTCTPIHPLHVWEQLSYKLKYKDPGTDLAEFRA